MTRTDSSGAAVGIDIGGTTIKLGLADTSGRLLAGQRIPYASLRSFDELVDVLARSIEDVATEARRRPSGIGIAAPGHARSSDGLMVDGTANVPLLTGRSLTRSLAERTRISCVTINDGSAATLGELHFGAGRGRQRFVLLTFGTGVGGGVVLHGSLVSGDEGVPPELGAIVLDDRPGAPGTLEHFASASGFSTAYEQHGGPSGCPPAEIFRLASQGDSAAAEAIDLVCRRIAQAVGTLVNALNLEACLLGGGIAQAGAPLLEGVRCHLADFTWPFLLARAHVELALTGEDAGVLGAAWHALDGEGHAAGRATTGT